MDSAEKTRPLNGELKVILIKTRDLPFPTTLSNPSGSGDLRGPHPYAIVDFDKNQVISHARYPGPYEPPVWAGEEKENSYMRNYTYSFDVTRQAELQIWLYQPAARGANVNTDAFLGKTCFRPLLTEDSKITQKWLSLDGGVGAISIMTQFISTEPLTTMTPILEPFDIRNECQKTLSSLATAVILRKKDTKMDYASIVLRKGKHDGIALMPAATQINNPFVIPLKFKIEVAKDRHYILCPFLHNYNLSEHLESMGSLEVTEARLYAAQIICALDCLHGLNIVYGRLKPRSIYIDLTGCLFLGDFDLYMRNISSDRLPWVRIPSDVEYYAPNETDKSDQLHVDDYLAPELVATQDNSHNIAQSADWWSFGVVLHQMLTGCLPFKSADHADKARSFPTYTNGAILQKSAEDILTKLLSWDPLSRLGANGSEEIKSHPFFDDIDWAKLLKKDYIPRFRPPYGKEPISPDRPCGSPGPSESPLSEAQQLRLETVFKDCTPQAKDNKF